MKALRIRLLAIVALLLVPSVAIGPPAAADATCGLAAPAFCDPLATASVNTGRSGELDPGVWGASRVAIDNSGQGWFDAFGMSSRTNCDAAPPILSPSDLEICNGALLDTVNDAGSDAGMSWYPRQPFDFAGRTGTVVFDVTDDTLGGHHAWPSFAITSTPAPAPNAGEPPESLRDIPANGFGFQIDDFPSGTTNCVTLGPGYVVTNYAATFVNPTVTDGCVQQPGGTATGQGDLTQFNHFAVQVSQSKVVLYGTDAGTASPLKELGEFDNLSLSFTRGLIWLQHGTYNADKYAPGQADHTFAWRNVGFDGPVLPRDLGYEIADANTQTTFYGKPAAVLGWMIPNGQSKTFTFPNVQGVENASGALLVYNFSSAWNMPNATYQVNGNAAGAYPYPIPANLITQTDALGQPGNMTGGFQQGVIALPLSQLTDGSNTISLQFDQNTEVANVDLILQGAGSGAAPPTPTPQPTVTVSPAPTATASATATVTGASETTITFSAVATGGGQTFPVVCTEQGGHPSTVICKGS